MIRLTEKLKKEKTKSGEVLGEAEIRVVAEAEEQSSLIMIFSYLMNLRMHYVQLYKYKNIC